MRNALNNILAYSVHPAYFYIIPSCSLIAISSAMYFTGVCSNSIEAFLWVLTGIIFGTTFLVIGFFNSYKRLTTLKNLFSAAKKHQLLEVSRYDDDLTTKNAKDSLNFLNTEINLAKKYISSDEVPVIDEEWSNSELLKLIVDTKQKMNALATEERNRNWTTEGIAFFADLLRKHQNNVEELSYQVILNLCKYLNANQGGMFVKTTGDDHKPILQLKGCYAYERKKYVEKNVKPGQGWVGQCYLEKDIIYMRNVPADYVHITSGLGLATPRNILVAPLIYNNEVYGVIELAAFELFENHKIEFVKKLAESIAATLSVTIINQQTQKMVEELQAYNEQMKSQEEELRQNMEELSATHEEMERKEKEINRLLVESAERERLLNDKLKELEIVKTEQVNAIHKLSAQKQIIQQVIEQLPEKVFLKDSSGKFVLLNSALAEGYNKNINELIGTSDFDNFDHKLANEWRKIELEIMSSGKPNTCYEDFPDANGQIRKLYCVKMPFRFADTGEIGILGYQVDVTEIKRLEDQVKQSELKMRQREAELEKEIYQKQAQIEQQLKKIMQMQVG